MAEAVITGIAGEIIANLVPRTRGKVGKLWSVNGEVKKLTDIVCDLRDVLDDAENQYHQREIKDWLNKLEDAFYDGRDMLEELSIEAMRQELRGHNKMIKEVRTFFSSSNQLAFKLKMSYKLKAMRKRMEAFLHNKNFHLNGRRDDRQEKWPRRETHSFMVKQDFIGRDDDKNAVMQFLLDLNVKENVSILPIVGMGGLGKTSLAKFVYNDDRVNKHFHLKMWVCVANHFDMERIAKKIIDCVEHIYPNEVAMEQLQSEFRAKIDGKRYLLVLDDLWIKDPKKWEEMQNLLMGGARGSKILITTRDREVATSTGTTLPHILEGLSDRESLDLFLQSVGLEREEMEDPDIVAITNEIVKKCSGMPLAIRTIGNLLYSRTKADWLNFKDRALSTVSQMEYNIIYVLKLSYDILPSNLKQCFAFCSLFPKGYEIKKQTLINIWMAEGFVQPSNGSPHLEDIANGYFIDLLQSSLLERDSITNTETCKMHNLIHDLACSVAGSVCWVAWDDQKSISERTRYISHGLTSNLMGKLAISSFKGSRLSTLLSVPTSREMEQRKPTSEADLHQLIQSFKRLRILDLHATIVKKVPRSICKLKHLTYLDLSHNNALKRLPNSITRLQNLQTLNLQGCFALKELPRDIRKLVSLRNLDIDYCYNLSYVPCGLQQLKSLHRLTRFILPKGKALAKNYCGLAELNGLNDLSGSLSIENLGHSRNALEESKEANLIEKRSLESLILKWGYLDTDDAVIDDADDAVIEDTDDAVIGNTDVVIVDSDDAVVGDADDAVIEHTDDVVIVDSDDAVIGDADDAVIEHTDDVVIVDSDDAVIGDADDAVIEHTDDVVIVDNDDAVIGDIDKILLDKLRPHSNLQKLTIDGYEGRSFPKWMMDSHELSLPKLVEVRLLRCTNCRHLPPLGRLPELKSLEIWRLTELEDIEKPQNSFTSMASFPRLSRLEIRDCENLKNMPLAPHLEDLILRNVNRQLINQIIGLKKLKSLDLSHMEFLECLPENCLQNLTSLERLGISECPRLTSLSGMQHLPNLVRLSLSNCGELDLSKGESDNILDSQGLKSLRFMDILGISKLASLPRWLLQVSNLEHLSIKKCLNLKALPENIEALQSLQQLEIIRCPSLTSLPERMPGLASLSHLRIAGCPNLEERCKEDIGEDWYKIKDIRQKTDKLEYYERHL